MRMATPTAKRVIGLTGTPAPNGLIDLWAQMYCIDMGERLGRSVTKYRETYFETHKWNNIIVRCNVKKGYDEVIRKKIADICLSMQAKDLQKRGRGPLITFVRQTCYYIHVRVVLNCLL